MLYWRQESSLVSDCSNLAPSEAPRKAVVLGITDEGRLRIRMEDGNEKTLSFGDVSLALPSAETA